MENVLATAEGKQLSLPLVVGAYRLNTDQLKTFLREEHQYSAVVDAIQKWIRAFLPISQGAPDVSRANEDTLTFQFQHIVRGKPAYFSREWVDKLVSYDPTSGSKRIPLIASWPQTPVERAKAAKKIQQYDNEIREYQEEIEELEREGEEEGANQDDIEYTRNLLETTQKLRNDLARGRSTLDFWIRFEPGPMVTPTSQFAAKLSIANTSMNLPPGLLGEVMKFQNPSFKGGPTTGIDRAAAANPTILAREKKQESRRKKDEQTRLGKERAAFQETLGPEERAAAAEMAGGRRRKTRRRRRTSRRD